VWGKSQCGGKASVGEKSELGKVKSGRKVRVGGKSQSGGKARVGEKPEWEKLEWGKVGVDEEQLTREEVCCVDTPVCHCAYDNATNHSQKRRNEIRMLRILRRSPLGLVYPRKIFVRLLRNASPV